MAVYTGVAAEEPWNFVTTNVREMLAEAVAVAFQAELDRSGVTEPQLLIAINHLRHAADELERSRLEMKYGVKR